MNDVTKQLIRSNVGKIARDIVNLGMPKAAHRLSRLEVMLDAANTNGIILREIEELWNAVESDTYAQFFCHYPPHKVGFVLNGTKTWESAIKAFPSGNTEISAGIDCYALGHNTACVFHMCRVAEIGLRAIGRERGVKTVRGNVPIEWGTWGQILGAIEPTLEKVRKRPNGRQKEAALAFYSTVLSDLRAILNLYRDPTMHLRDLYDDGEAQSAMIRVNQLMTMLASKLDENSTRSIPWSAWK